MTEPKKPTDYRPVPCPICEYCDRCFFPLKFLKLTAQGICRQGRKKKEYRQKQATLDEAGGETSI
jgi:hypothetical protein